MNRILWSLVLAACLLPGSVFCEEPPLPPDPVYVRLDDGWVGIYARADQYVEYRLAGTDIQLQDAYHVLLKPQVGLMVNFADKREFAQGGDMLEAHRQWEIAYWRKQGKGKSRARDDLAGGRHDLKVTEITVYPPKKPALKAYLVGVALSDGVFVLSVSPADAKLDADVKKIIASITVVNQRLDIKAEAERLVAEPDKGR